jgi:MFS family permease
VSLDNPKNANGLRSRLNWRLPGSDALRFRDYRLFWFGYVTEVSGQQMLWVAQGWLIYELSGSAVLLGAAGLARAVPATVLSFVGGALADKFDQRRLLIGVQLVQMTLLLALGTLTATGQVEVWHLFVLLSASAAAQSFENPSRQAIFPRLVPGSALMDAVALNTVVHPGSRFFGPFLGGLLMAQVRLLTDSDLAGAATLFYITSLGYVMNAAFLYLIRMPRVEAVPAKTSLFQDMVMGVKFIARNHIFTFLIAMTYCSQFFGWSFQSLFPVFAKDVFGGGEFELGLMYSALGAGSFIGATLAPNLGRTFPRGLLIIGGFLAEGLLLVLFSSLPLLGPALVVLVFTGISQATFNVSAQSTLQYLVPNDYRGRVMGIWGMTYSTVQPLGQMQMGAIAGAVSAPFAVMVGGLGMIAFSVALALPNGRLRRLTLESEAPEEEREAAVARHRG